MLINECCDNHIDAITQGSPFCWSHLWVKFMNGSKISITNTAVVSNIFKNNSKNKQTTFSQLFFIENSFQNDINDFPVGFFQKRTT